MHMVIKHIADLQVLGSGWAHWLPYIPFSLHSKTTGKTRHASIGKSGGNGDVIIINRYHDAARQAQPDEEGYKGLRVHALTGLHDCLEKKIVAVLKPSCHVLDVAAGSGAMSLRLHDLGFKVTATDIVPENFRLHGHIPFVRANLNNNFCQKIGKTFDAIVALEIIEHVENPRNFLRQCFKLLKSGGILILSTPNTDSPVSKALFVRFGMFQWFSDDDYKTHGHITPISQWYLSKCAAEVGLSTVWKGSYGDPFRLARGWPKLRLLAWLLRRLSLTDPSDDGEIFITMLKKPDA